MAHHYQQGCVEVIQLDERMTVEEVEEIRPLLTAALNERLPQVVIDLRRVRLIDSAGLELLTQAHARCLRRGGTLRLSGAAELIREVFRVTGLDQELALHADVVSAAGAFAL